jgi:Leucine-rich repeat (LRR) protein
MFIKKDLRKIPEILADAANKGKENTNSSSTSDDNDNEPFVLLQDLQLQRRKAEFQGSVRTLCQPSHAPFLTNLQSLSLYDCNISDLTGIGLLSSLTSLSLGRNPLITSLPDEFADLQQLQELCLDDCSLSPDIPTPLLALSNLHELRLSNNHIERLPENFGHLLGALRILGLDHNRLTHLPNSMSNLIHLTTLLVRHNQLTSLPANFPGSSMTQLQLLHVSSNQLTSLPDCIVDCSSLTHVYANCNALVHLPMGMELLYNLKHLNLAHNQLHDDNADDDTCRQRLHDLYDLFGKPNEDGNCVDKKSVKVMLRGNPALVPKDKKMKKKKKQLSPTAQDDKDDDDNLSSASLDMDLS